jgi:hypothetical protein
LFSFILSSQKETIQEKRYYTEQSVPYYFPLMKTLE